MTHQEKVIEAIEQAIKRGKPAQIYNDCAFCRLSVGNPQVIHVSKININCSKCFISSGALEGVNDQCSRLAGMYRASKVSEGEKATKARFIKVMKKVLLEAKSRPKLNTSSRSRVLMKLVKKEGI